MNRQLGHLQKKDLVKPKETHHFMDKKQLRLELEVDKK